ncbi:MAG TPA: class II glutamine amidotransferase [Anaeromyxobacteraceae bacterium]|nr:class II glutamine amidotransferase [Anaeromyxobacteraceae bacterium]
MCRLFAQHARADHQSHEPLCVAHNALRTQSHQHPHGWGIAWYDESGVQVRRGVMPAHADDAFVAAAREARSEIVVAHVRDASVGPVTEKNTHPFVYGPWLFAHNGTVARYRRVARVRAALVAEIDPALRRAIAGDTDSERCFFLFLTRLAARVPSNRPAELSEVRRALAETVASVTRIADSASENPSSLNFLVSDGRLLAVCRRGRTLHVAQRTEQGGLFAIASEPIGQGPWRPVAEGGFVGIDPAYRVHEGSLLHRRLLSRFHPRGPGRPRRRAR